MSISHDTKSLSRFLNCCQIFKRAAKLGQHTQKGWANSAYGTSKMCVSQATVIQQKEFDSDSRSDIVLNCVSPSSNFSWDIAVTKY